MASKTHIRRCHIHFAGLEPLNAKLHRRRFSKSCSRASELWDCNFKIVNIDKDTERFSIEASGDGWKADNDVLIMAAHEPLRVYLSQPVWYHLLAFLYAFFQSIVTGTLFKYYRHAWRFASYAISPLIIVVGIVAILLLGSHWLSFGQPLNYLWSVPLMGAVYWFAFRPLIEKVHLTFGFSSWRFGRSCSLLSDPEHLKLFAKMETEISTHLQGDYDEILITCHSYGTNIAVHVIGSMLEKDAQLFGDTPVTFAQLGGSLAVTSLAPPAHIVRKRVGLIVRQPNLNWIELQCISDVLSFYKVDPIATAGHHGFDDKLTMVMLRFKHILTPASYRAIKYDALAVHLQFVMGAEKRYFYDFIPFIAGPYIAQERAQRLAMGKPALEVDGS